MDEGQVKWFGPKWDAPVTDDCEQIEPPIGELCVFCDRAIEAGQRGISMASGFVEGRRSPTHINCLLRNVLGPTKWKVAGFTNDVQPR